MLEATMSAGEASTEGTGMSLSASGDPPDDKDFDPDIPADGEIVVSESKDSQSASESSETDSDKEGEDEADVPITGEELKKLRIEQDYNDEKMLLKLYEDMRDASDQATAEAYVKAIGEAGKALIARLKSPFVKTSEGEVHKKSIASLINKGQNLRRHLTDHDKRVREVTRHSSGKGDDTLVANTFLFGEGKRQRWVRLEDEDEADSGADVSKQTTFAQFLYELRFLTPMRRRQ